MMLPALYSRVLSWVMRHRFPQEPRLSASVTVNVPKNIVITGASSGLGEKLALEYAASGVSLALFGRDRDRLDTTVRACEQKRASAAGYTVDVCDARGMRNAINEYNARHPIDLVIINAGVSGGVADAPMEDIRQIDTIIKVNISGALNTIEPAVKLMKERKRGQIVIICSFLALRGIPGQPTYCASKAAMLSYGESLRMELSLFNIGVTMVCCGYIRTPMSVGNPLLWAAIDPADCARRIRRDVSRNVAISFPPFYMSAVMQLMCAVLPRRVVDFIVGKFFPRRQPMRL
jgi:short-subunit dehydrogenase